jgi:hypothetical protein
MLAFALLLELLGGVLLVAGRSLYAWELLFVLLQCLSSAAMTVFVADALPDNEHRRRRPELLFLFTLAVLVPVIGPAAMAAGILIPVKNKKKQDPISLLIDLKAPPLPFRAPEVSQEPMSSEGRLLSVLRHSLNPDQHLRAVVATRLLADQDGVLILADALKSQFDDVRLLAYGLVDSKQRRLLGRIQKITKSAQAAKGRTRIGHHKQLAYDNWELVYLGLIQGEMLLPVLASAAHFARLALEGHPRDASLTLLFGRILLRQGELADAERAFRHALDLGLPGSAVNPYLAEVAFRQRRFADIAGHLQDESNEWAPEKLTAMVTFWT